MSNESQRSTQVINSLNGLVSGRLHEELESFIMVFYEDFEGVLVGHLVVFGVVLGDHSNFKIKKANGQSTSRLETTQGGKQHNQGRPSQEATQYNEGGCAIRFSRH